MPRETPIAGVWAVGGEKRNPATVSEGRGEYKLGATVFVLLGLGARLGVRVCVCVRACGVGGRGGILELNRD